MPAKYNSPKIQSIVNGDKFKNINNEIKNIKEILQRSNSNSDAYVSVKKKVLELDAKLNALNLSKINSELKAQNQKHANALQMVNSISKDINTMKKDLKLNNPQLVTKIQNELNKVKTDLTKLSGQDQIVQNLKNIVAAFKNDIVKIKSDLNVAEYTVADKRVLTDIKNIDKDNFIAQVHGMKLHEYKVGDEVHSGVIADDIIKSCPRAVKKIAGNVGKTKHKDLKVVDDHELVTVLLGAVKQLIDDVQELKKGTTFP